MLQYVLLGLSSLQKVRCKSCKERNHIPDLSVGLELSCCFRPGGALAFSFVFKFVKSAIVLHYSFVPS